MTTLKGLRSILRDWIEDETIDDVFQNYINYAVAECESIVNFVELRNQKTITVPSTGIFTEPARCREIVSIYPSPESGYPAYQFERRDRVYSVAGGVYTGYTMEPSVAVRSPELTLSCSFSQYGTVLTNVGTPWVTSDNVGDRLMISSDDELYEITAVDGTTITVFPEINAEDSDASNVYVTPPGTRRHLLRDPSYTAFEGDVVVVFQEKHPLLNRDESVLLIPCPRSVALIALQNALMTNKYDVDAQRLASQIMKAKNEELDNHAYKTVRSHRLDPLFARKYQQ